MADGTWALVVATAPGALTVVAGLPLALRAVLTLRAAGHAALAVFAGPQARRVAALLGARCPDVPVLGTPEEAAAVVWPARVLVAAGDTLVDGHTLAPLTASAARDGDERVHLGRMDGGAEVVAAVVPGGAVPGLLAALARGNGLKPEALARAGAGAPVAVPLAGLFVRAEPGRPVARLEAALLEALARRTTAKDSYMAALVDRRLSRPLTRLLLSWPVTPSQVTLASIALGLAGAAGLATVSYGWRVAGVLALILSIVLDCVDGELARARFQQSAAGARLDVLGDYTVHLAVFAGLAAGLTRQGLPPAGAWAALALVGGIVAATVVTHALFVRPALAGGGDLHASGHGGVAATPLGPIIEKLASRDYTYLLLVLALLGRLEWFLYGAAAGSWAFVGALLAYAAYHRRPTPNPLEPA
jgi:phosphatidylglycerophosphate synthase